MLGTLVLAQDLYVEPATDLAREVQGLFNITLAIALFVFVFVEGLLIYMIVKFRKNTKVPREESHRGHTTAEVVWTVIPAAILLFLGFLSAGTLVKLDEIPDDTDFTVHVEASQFQWRFFYPDASGTAYNGESDWCRAPNADRCTFHTLRLREGTRVKIELSSRDVIHAFAMPELAIKLDAVPGKKHVQWFDVPPVNGAATREIFIQCMEYCGTGHHLMGPSVETPDSNVPKLVIFPAADPQPLDWGTPAAAPPAP